MKDGLSAEAAQQYMEEIVGKHAKPHGQDYSLYDYTPQTKTHRIQELNLVI